MFPIPALAINLYLLVLKLTAHLKLINSIVLHIERTLTIDTEGGVTTEFNSDPHLLGLQKINRYFPLLVNSGLE